MSGGKRLKKTLWYFIALLVVLSGLLVIAGIATKYMIAPNLVRSRVLTTCSRYWTGSMEIGRVKFNYFEPLRLENIRLVDSAGRVWASVGAVTMTLKEPASFQPVVTDIAAEDLTLHVYRSEPFPPIARITEIPDESQLNLASLTARGVWLILHEVDLSERRYGPGTLTVGRDREFHNIRLDMPRSEELPPIVADIRAEPSGERGVRFSGSVTADAKPLAEEFRLTLAYRDDNELFDEVKLDANLLGGSVHGLLSLDRPPGEAVRYSGFLRAEGLELKRLPQRQTSDDTGAVTGRLTFRGSGVSLENLQGRGLVLLENVNARGDPLTREIFTFFNNRVGENNPASSIEAVFTLRGSMVTLRRAVLADALSVMQVEPGGTIDLQTRELDLYIITLQLRGLSGVLTNIPIVNFAAILASKLTRLHVTGTWDDKKFSKEPVEDLSAGTLEFLQEAIRLGGRLGPRVHGTFIDLFQAVEPPGEKLRNTEPEPPRP
ncbi:MAG: hypothetical protein ACYSTL_06155 [Planctomycetota bacterium]